MECIVGVVVPMLCHGRAMDAVGAQQALSRDVALSMLAPSAPLRCRFDGDQRIAANGRIAPHPTGASTPLQWL